MCIRDRYIPEAQSALTEALGVYDLSDGFKKHKIAELSSNPLYMVIAVSYTHLDVYKRQQGRHRLTAFDIVNITGVLPHR